jgi:hypothetical protein
VAVWQIAVFAQQAQFRFEATGLQVSRPSVIGMLTRRVLLPYGQLRKARFDLANYPDALEASVIAEQRSIMFDLLKLRQHNQRFFTTAEQPVEQLRKHPFVRALDARGIPLETRTNPQDDWQALEL